MGANLYEVLGLDPSVTTGTSDIKQAYRQALLTHHPDKRQQRNSDGTQTATRIQLIKEAFEVLSDPVKRKEYDASVRKTEILVDGLDTLDLADFEEVNEIEDNGDTSWVTSCPRCKVQKGFSISETELVDHADEGELIVQCNTCSLFLRVTYQEDSP